MARLQRARLIAAVSELVEEVGHQRLTVAAIIARTRVSRRVFYDVFSSREDCILALLAQTVEQAARQASEAYHDHDTWRTGIRAALQSVLLRIEDEPHLARLCLIEAPAGGPRISAFLGELKRQVAQALDLGRDDPAARRDPPQITAEAVAGGLFSVVQNWLCEQRAEPLTELLGPLMNMITLPYLGARAASRELSKPALSPRPRGHNVDSSQADPLNELKISLTYRTVRALVAIAELPGASNRQVALAAGIGDEGQVSKLLSRLSALGLVENTGGGQRRGVANAWRLTAQGKQLHLSVGSHLAPRST